MAYVADIQVYSKVLYGFALPQQEAPCPVDATPSRQSSVGDDASIGEYDLSIRIYVHNRWR